MPGSTKFEREIYEQFVIIEKYGKDWKNQEYLLNKVNPVGGKYNLNSEKGMSLFMEKAKEVAKKYNLPTKF